MIGKETIKKITSDLKKEGLELTTYSNMFSEINLSMRNLSNEKFYFVRINPREQHEVSDEKIMEIIEFMKMNVQGKVPRQNGKQANIAAMKNMKPLEYVQRIIDNTYRNKDDVYSMNDSEAMIALREYFETEVKHD